MESKESQASAIQVDLRALPLGFDGTYYLEVNEDVRAAGMDPAEHFLLYGRQERRVFRRPFPADRWRPGQDWIRGYIYTTPKAGTYLFSDFLSGLGLTSTGWHIEPERFLDTQAHDLETNRSNPSATAVVRNYINSFRDVPRGMHAFGHLSPLFIAPTILRRGFRVLAVKRHPREVLESEFIDFRYRRADVLAVNQAVEPDARKAFVAHLSTHGRITFDVCLSFMLYERLQADAAYNLIQGRAKPLVLAFEEFLNPDTGPACAERIAAHFSSTLTPEAVHAVRLQALAADNKTRATDLVLDVPRHELWTDEARALYAAIGFEAVFGF